MSLLLNIDTATEHASICLSKNGESIAFSESLEQKSHGSFLQPAIKKIFEEVNISLNSIDAIAITHGPGSYTGLRVGMASAKGLCYALNKPLMVFNTLEVMAAASIKLCIENSEDIASTLFCPMIDARRMEVFTAIYDGNLQNTMPPEAIILTEASFETILNQSKIVFNGSGQNKFKSITKHANAYFIEETYNATDMIVLAEKGFSNNQFANLAYSEPFYLKEFFNPSIKK